MKTICLIGYAGHAFVIYDCFFSQGQIVSTYTEVEEKKLNPFSLKYLGNESNSDVVNILKGYDYFVAIGDNLFRRKISEKLFSVLGEPVIALHKTAILSRSIKSGTGVMIGPRVIVNAFAEIGDGVILNSGSIVEHECKIGAYAHIAPGAVLCGGVTIGENTLIGAGTVIKPGIQVGKNVTIGIGSVIVKDIPDNEVVAGNPAKKI